MENFSSSKLKKGGDDLKRLASLIKELLTAAIDARKGLKARWDQKEQIIRNDPAMAGVKLYDNFEPRVFDTMSPWINRIVNTTIGAFEAPGTWYQAIPDDGSDTDALERGVQSVLERAQYIRTLRTGLHTAAACGVGILRVRMTEQGVVIDHIHPNDFAVSPTYGVDLREAHFLAHRFYIPRWKLRLRQKDNYDLLDEDLIDRIAPTDPDSDPSGRDPAYDKSRSDDTNVYKDSDLIELWECIVRIEIDGKPGVCRVVYNDQNVIVLLKEDFIYDEPWYFDLRFHDEVGKFWPAGSIAQAITGICLMKNDMLNLAAAGSMATCANPTYVSGAGLGQKQKKLSLGQVYETPYDVQVHEIPLHFDMKAMPLVLEYIDRALEAQSGVSSQRLGIDRFSGERVTAREIAAIETAAQQNEGSYSSFIAPFLERIAGFVQKLIRFHQAPMKSVYGNSISGEAYAQSRTPVRWQVTGRAASNSPEIVLGKLQAMLTLASNPASGFNYHAVEKAVVEQMALPMDTKRLEKTSEQMAAAMAALQNAQAAGGESAVNGEMAQQPGMGVPPVGA